MSAGIRSVLVTLARLQKRIFNPVAFVNRDFIRRCGAAMDVSSESGLACLDVGAGTSPYESTLRTQAHVHTYVALDVAPSDRTSVVGDCTKLPVGNGTFDFIVAFDVIAHIEYPGQMLSEAYRALKPGGYLLITYTFFYPECDARDFRRWTVDGMRAFVSAHGFVQVVEQRRGGALFAFTSWAVWAVQHAIPGQRRSWRASRSWKDFARGASVLVLTFPFQMLGWVALAVDSLLPSRGIYMGACILAKKATVHASEGQR